MLLRNGDGDEVSMNYNNSITIVLDIIVSLFSDSL